MDDKFISVNRFKETLSRLRVEGGNKEFIQGIAQALSEAVPKLLDDEPAADVQPVNRWISFENTTPRTSGVFNVIYKSNERKFVTSCYYDGIDTWYHDVGINHDRIVTDKVIMWQPLPEPPKGGDTE